MNFKGSPLKVNAQKFPFFSKFDKFLKKIPSEKILKCFQFEQHGPGHSLFVFKRTNYNKSVRPSKTKTERKLSFSMYTSFYFMDFIE